jgi:hypothetical protein
VTDPADGDAPVLVATTAKTHVSTWEWVAIAFAVSSALTMAWGLVQLARGVYDDGVGLSVGGLVLTALLVLLASHLRRVGRCELQVRPGGLVLLRRDSRRAWRWDELRDLYVLGGIDRPLVVVPAAAGASQRAPRGAQLAETLGGVPPGAVVIPLRGMVPEERRILDAVEAASGGRLPSPERGPRLPGR